MFKLSNSLSESLLNLFQQLHTHPELSNHEIQTTLLLKQQLQEAGIHMLDLPIQTGVVAEIGEGELCIALRADIDALPIQEQTTLPYRSQQAGVMHACGHDFHATTLMGAAYLLKQQESQLAGRIRLFFQPAEENFSGAQEFIQAGALQGVNAIFGIHNNPQLPVGHFTTRAGALNANVDRFEIHVHGKGAHAARPETGVDPLVIAAQIITALQTIPSRSISGLDPAIVSVTRLQAGNTWNVIPESAVMEGTVRTHCAKVRQKVAAQLRQLATGIAQSFGAKAEVLWEEGPPAVINHAHWAEFTIQIAKQQGYVIDEIRPQMGGEDFAYYLQHVAGAFFNVGSASAYALHHPQFQADPAAIAPAAQYMATLAAEALNLLSKDAKSD